VILSALHDLLFGQNQQMKLAADEYVRDLKNKLESLGCLR